MAETLSVLNLIIGGKVSQNDFGEQNSIDEYSYYKGLYCRNRRLIITSKPRYSRRSWNVFPTAYVHGTYNTHFLNNKKSHSISTPKDNLIGQSCLCVPHIKIDLARNSPPRFDT